MINEQEIILTREQLYNEIWEISVAGVSKKYKAVYSELLKQCKELDIPIPPSGYWAKLKFGKKVIKAPLPESSIREVTLITSPVVKLCKHAPVVDSRNVDVQPKEKSEIETAASVQPESQDDQVVYRTVSGVRNTYNRDIIYQEVWEKPVVAVAMQYGVSDPMMHKICKSLNVPVPPRGYWSKLRAGAKMQKAPLPPSKGITEILGTKTFEGTKKKEAPASALAYLSESEREKVLLAARQIQVTTEDMKLHKKIIAYKSKIKEWNKKDRKPELAQRSSRNYINRPPFLAGVISNEALPRIFRILDSLFHHVESLGGSVNDDLSLVVRNEHVCINVSESQDEIKHEITKEEAREIIIFEDAKRHNKWAPEPQIRKYDYLFNGQLRIWIRQGRYFRDSAKSNIESKIGDILIELYEESEAVRIEREARERAVREREEEAKLREERRERYNLEIERTTALENEALDYEKACRIRAYVNAVEKNTNNAGSDDEIAAWIEWANKKADWFDPSISRNDELLGDREHEKNEDQKALKKSGYNWW